MSIAVKAYANCDDTYVVWRVNQRIDGCRGFALYRRRNGTEEIVDTWVGFDGDAAPPGTHKPSAEWPIQKFMWTDYMARAGDVVEYRVMPMLGVRGDLHPAETLASGWTDPVTVAAQPSGKITAYFNRGIVASQWLARRLGQATDADKQKKLGQIIEDVHDPTRQFLAGELRLAMLRHLDDAKTSGGKVYAALYELNDPELEDALLSLGKRAHVILANGATKKPGEDENAEARSRLSGKVRLYDRMVPSGHFAHNKFLVFCDAQSHPVAVWTGSTNWTKTGLCTQGNNGILFEHRRLAAMFKAQWERLRAAKDAFPDSLVAADSEAKRLTIDGAKVSVWFAPVREEEDLAQARTLIDGAEQGILFLMFNPGPAGTLLNAIVERGSPMSPAYKPDLYVHGVVNQDPSTTKHPVVGLFHRGQYTRASFDVVLPEAIDDRLAFWIPEIRKYKNAWAMVHSKVIVIDPFGAHPVVMTGSHNMGPKASAANDDNLVIVEDNHELAAAYAVNITSIYNQYRWRYYRMQQATPQWTGLEDNDTWQDGYLRGAKLRELRFWLGEG